jgi:hypothetical protein
VTNFVPALFYFVPLDKPFIIRSHPIVYIVLALLQQVRIKSVGITIKLKNGLALEG